MKFDASQVRAFAVELEKSTAGLEKDIRPVLQKGALNIKQEWQAALGASRSFKGVRSTPTFETKMGAGNLEAEIGPVTSGRVPGDLVSIAHFGGARGGGGVEDPRAFLDNEAPKFEKALGDVIRKALP